MHRAVELQGSVVHAESILATAEAYRREAENGPLPDDFSWSLHFVQEAVLSLIDAIAGQHSDLACRCLDAIDDMVRAGAVTFDSGNPRPTRTTS